MTLTRAQLHELYYYLRLNRRVDEQLTNLYRQGKVVGGVYSSLGQEAISVGTAYALGPEDFIGPMIRNVGAMLVRGYRPRDVFLQYMARQDGPTGGRDANTHFGDLARGGVAPISVLARLVPVRARADAERGQDDAHEGPRRARRCALRAAGRPREVAQEGPDPAL